jgi:hypothetical protein
VVVQRTFVIEAKSKLLTLLMGFELEIPNSEVKPRTSSAISPPEIRAIATADVMNAQYFPRK